jgi:hypothetical protein
MMDETTHSPDNVCTFTGSVIDTIFASPACLLPVSPRKILDDDAMAIGRFAAVRPLGG